ncbi:hypothetical protein CIB95_05335 [Lottiidibacillus patelloidae]|uniref:Uncharacterized protein n=1 Tax=Lottiidibacillus patelloidae TaxID=2670334 RepID=A0A263BVQ6_9BACI|nr:hypothetical protein [Lottiidibacillus patelloidae]OZM57790.1 hypothetical protein CIB95_05335 [Lottiidibacillus patelloidae]
MSLTKVKVFDVAVKQYLYKMKAYMWFIFSLIPLHVLALLLSLNGVATSGSGNNYVSIKMKLYSNEIFIIFTLLWILFGGVTLTTKAYRTSDFTFVSNRLSSNLSNIMYLFTLSVIGSITCFLSGYLLRSIAYFINTDELIINEAITYTASELFWGISVTALYLCLLGAIGYAFGMLVQFFKPFAFLLPALLFWSLLFTGGNNAVIKFVEFLVLETSFFIFTIKITTLLLALFSFSFLISNRLEVR